ncbi:hypothetical protein [Methylobacterium sp. E-045]|uniref:hypothetical protein n=1 Tax=Methylobacterium sp. E-045 TaxID=2836575 RepID=UPI001FBAC557|nr:hypothetical protein [Methylobacterium sp. E-045]MCJ2128340.1 hypothetical protein [Methylobacterium sp. E-045]
MRTVPHLSVVRVDEQFAIQALDGSIAIPIGGAIKDVAETIVARSNATPGAIAAMEAVVRLLDRSVEIEDTPEGFEPYMLEDLSAALSNLREGRASDDLSYSGAPMPPDGVEGCVYCGQPFHKGDLVLNEVEGGRGHITCMGPERDSYVDANGEPLKDGEPIPTGYPWKPSQIQTGEAL